MARRRIQRSLHIHEEISREIDAKALQLGISQSDVANLVFLGVLRLPSAEKEAQTTAPPPR